MFGPFNSRVAVSIGSVFGRASESIRQKRERSMARESQGQKARREDSDTDDLADQFETSVTQEIGNIQDALAQQGIKAKIEFHTTVLQVGEESKTGADMGIRLHISGPSYDITKAVFLQNKRMFGANHSASFDELKGRGEEQARKMLQITPASFFLLFNGLPVDSALDQIEDYILD